MGHLLGGVGTWASPGHFPTLDPGAFRWTASFRPPAGAAAAPDRTLGPALGLAIRRAGLGREEAQARDQHGSQQENQTEHCEKLIHEHLLGDWESDRGLDQASSRPARRSPRARTGARSA